jgi:hypothetical protein
MIRIILLCALAGASALAQTTSAAPAAPNTQLTQPSGMPPRPAPVPSAADLMAPDTVVITVQGLCSKSSTADTGKSGSCTTTLTKAQFNQMIAAMNVASPAALTPTARRNFAASYVHEMALAEAGRIAGIEKDPEFEELMKIVRVRTLAAAYSRFLEQKFGNPSPEEVEAYYRQNISRFEQLQLDRVFVPRLNAKKPNENRVDFEKKARQVIAEMRERAAKGEDAEKLQAEAYTTLGLTSPPPTNFGFKRKGAFPPVLEQELFSLHPGEVSKTQVDPAGFTFYKVRSHDALPLASLKDQLAHELTEKNREAAVRAVLGNIQTNLNEKFFEVTEAPVVRRPGMPVAPR